MRNIISVFIIVVVVVLVINIDIDKNDSFSSNNNDEKQWNRIAAVLDHAWDEFGLFSFQLTPDSTIFIEMDETKDELQLIQYLEANVNKTDLNQYTIDITKKNLQDVETMSFMMGVSGIVSGMATLLVNFFKGSFKA